MFGKLKKNYFLLITTFLFLYFFFNFLDGERGLFSYFKKKNLLINLQNEEIDLTNWRLFFKLLLSCNLILILKTTICIFINRE